MDQNKLALLLSTLYSSTDNESIQIASKQLNDWQQTVDAWAQADQLLSAQGLQSEFYYFFAQTLKTKIQYDMYQLPATSHISLRDSLIQKLLAVAHSSAAKATRKQLCLAISDLTIQATGVWSTAIPDLVNLLQADHLGELLEILKLIPEETENLKLMTETENRNQSRHKCLEYYYSVLELLSSKFVVNPPTEIRQGILACFLAWLKFDSPPIQYSLVDSPVIKYCLNELSNISPSNLDINETVVEILTEIVETASTYRNRTHHNPLIEHTIFPQISLVVSKLLGTDLQAELESDEEALKAVVRLLVVTGEGMMTKIANEYMTSAEIQQFLLILIKVFGLQSLELSELCCPFFEDFLTATASGQGGNIQSSVVHDKLFESLVIRLDVTTEPSFNGTDPFGSVDSDFFQFRTNSLISLLYVLSRDFLGRSTGTERLVRGLIHHASGNNGSMTVQEGFALAIKDQLNPISDPSVSVMTAIDFMIEALPGWIDVSTVHACTLVDAFKRRGLLAMIGSLGSWFRTEAQLFKIIDVLAQVLIRPAVAHRSIHLSAATSFRDLCFNTHCRNLIVANNGAVESVTKLFNQTIGHLHTREHSLVTEGITSVLSACADDAVFNNLMRSLILIPLIQSLDAYRASSDLANTGMVIDRLTAVVRSVTRLRPGSSRYTMVGELIVSSLWPSLAGAMETFRSDSELVEKGCRLIKHSLRTVPEVFKRLLIPLGQLLIRDFSATQHSSYLYTAEVLVQEYGQDAEVRPALTELFRSLASDGVRITQQRITSSQFGQDTVDELIEDLYGMIERFLRFSPTIVVKSGASIQAVIGLLVPVFARISRTETIEAVSAFTEQLYSGQWTHSIDIGTVSNDEVMAIRKALSDVAPVLVQELFALLISVCNRPMRHAIPSLLMTINTFDQQAYRTDWLPRGLQRVPVSIMTDRDKGSAAAALSSLDDERAVTSCVEDILYRAELVGRRMRNELK